MAAWSSIRARRQSANAQKCWNWFSPGDQQRDQGEPALIAGITRQVMRDHAVDPRRVYVAGLSAGGAAAAIMGQAYPDLYAAVGRAFRPGLRRGARHAIGLCRHAAGRRGDAAARPRPARTAAGASSRPSCSMRTRTTRCTRAMATRSSPSPAAAGGLRTEVQRGQVPGGHAYSRTIHADAGGQPVLEQWLVHGGGHAWSGGSAAGSYTDPRGPDASREMLRFFLEHPHGIDAA